MIAHHAPRTTHHASRTLKLTIAYDGTAYAGWQRQDQPGQRHIARRPTVQAALEAACYRVLRERVDIVGSGRTDSGVHALAQVAHIRTRSTLPTATIQRAVNHYVPDDIVITRIQRVAGSFHARRSARRKRYRYRVAVSPYPSPFTRRYAHYVRGALNVAAMRQATRALVGTHDFAPFQARGAVIERTIRRVTQARWLRRNGELWFDIEANGFLYKMARRIVGTLLEVGRGQRPAACIRQILDEHNARLVGPTAPPHGLSLVSVTY